MHASSFRDPSGFVFEHQGTLYRQVNRVFAEDFKVFINSGCYQHMVDKKWLIAHEVIDQNLTDSAGYFMTIQPERIPFISYPYEWSFDMLKDAALLTLQLVKESLDFGMILKDASAYNVQWKGSIPIFIDTLSFEKYDPAQPWVAYRQFCEHFLAPLLLAHFSGHPLQKMMITYPDGIPLELAAALLPRRTKFSIPVFLHLHMHASLSGKKTAKKEVTAAFSKRKMENLVDSLTGLVRSLKWKGKKSTWENYYKEAGSRKDYLQDKLKLVESMAGACGRIETAVDLGANEGSFTKLLARKGIRTIACDMDHNTVNRLYLRSRENREEDVYMIISDLSHPSPAIGLNNKERPALLERVPSDLTLALALIHHLCIGKNIPFENLATLFAQISPYLIIEFVPKDDEKVKLMLQGRKDIFDWYTEERFAEIFQRSYTLMRKTVVAGSARTIYLFRRHA
jgi:hypothetical protein